MASGYLVWKRFGKYLRPYWGRQALLLICLLTGIALGMVLPFGIRYLVDQVITPKNSSLLLPVMGLLAGAVLLQGILAVGRDFLFTSIGQHLLYDLRKDLISHLHRLPVSFFDRTETGEIISRIWNDSEALTEITTGALPRLITQVLTFAVTATLLFLFEWRLGLIALGGIPLFLLAFGSCNRKLYGTARGLREKIGGFLARLQEEIAGIRTIRAFGRGRYRYLKLMRLLAGLMKSNVLLQLYGSFTVQGAGIIVLGWPLVALGYGAFLITRGTITLGTLLAAWFLVSQLFTPLVELSNLNVSFQRSAAALARIFDFLDRPSEERPVGDSYRTPRLQGEVTFNRVSFSYQEGQPVLEDLSFRLPAGSFTALVGPSGAGKSTVTHLLLGFYQPQEGNICLDGVPLNIYDPYFRRQHLVSVPQDIFLFHGSISENIALGSRLLGEEEIAAAGREAGVEEFTGQLPQGYETIVGGNGGGLSGGQRQRVGIARALIRHPALLILDEATASLDSRSESLIRQTLDRIRGRCTILVIAHRLSTVISADRIILLDQGRLIDSGSHQELWERQSLYRELFGDRNDANGQENSGEENGGLRQTAADL